MEIGKSTDLWKVIPFIFVFSLCSLKASSQSIFSLQKQENTATNAKCNCPIYLRKCKGEKVWKNGDHYKGQFKFGKPHGKGTITYASGEVYTGEFFKGEPDGFGKMTYVDNSYYEGEWSFGWKHGSGVYNFACGNEYLGMFEEDVIQGEGTLLYSNGESYSGDWKNNSPHGNGTFKRLDGSHFVGTRFEGEKDGEGMIIWESGDTLKANWVEDKIEDNATFIFSDGSSLVTYWISGEMLPELSYQLPNGEEVLGPSDKIAHMVISNNFEQMESIENNLQLAYYGFALEYQSIDNTKMAVAFLNLAKSFQSDEPNSEILNLVNNRIAQIKKKQNQIEVASKE